MISNETMDLLKPLLFAIETIIESDAEGKARIAGAYYDARSLLAATDVCLASARPRITGCLKVSNMHAGDVAAAGWMLAAIQERLADRDLYGWQKLEKIVYVAALELTFSQDASPR